MGLVLPESVGWLAAEPGQHEEGACISALVLQYTRSSCWLVGKPPGP